MLGAWLAAAVWAGSDKSTSAAPASRPDRIRVYAGASLEAGNVWDRSSAMDLGDLRLAGMLLGGADTLLGPVSLGYGRAEGGASSWYLFLGSPFSRRLR